MAETPVHRQNMTDVIAELDSWFEPEPMVYVSGNMLMYYVPGNKHKRVSPDVFVTLGIPKNKFRPYYLTWEEGKGPDLAIELTSKSTRHEDLKQKLELYRDILKIKEYFLFDPFGEYLKPPLRGFRLLGGEYRLIKPVNGRIPSKVLGLHLEGQKDQLRLFDVAAGKWLPTPKELIKESRSVIEQNRSVIEQNRSELAHSNAENERLRKELAALRKQIS